MYFCAKKNTYSYALCVFLYWRTPKCFKRKKTKDCTKNILPKKAFEKKIVDMTLKYILQPDIMKTIAENVTIVYNNDMDMWNAMSTEEQEKTIGRRKFNDLELTDEEKHKNAHNVITKVEQGGEELKIVRANVSFANASKGEFGTFFIGYSGKFSTTRTMLEQMFIGNPSGNADKILDFSTPKTGALFFVPSYEVLDRIANNDWE